MAAAWIAFSCRMLTAWGMRYDEYLRAGYPSANGSIEGGLPSFPPAWIKVSRLPPTFYAVSQLATVQGEFHFFLHGPTAVKGVKGVNFVGGACANWENGAMVRGSAGGPKTRG